MRLQWSARTCSPVGQQGAPPHAAPLCPTRFMLPGPGPQIMAAVVNGEQLLKWPNDAHPALQSLGHGCLAFEPQRRLTFAQVGLGACEAWGRSVDGRIGRTRVSRALEWLRSTSGRFALHLSARCFVGPFACRSYGGCRGWSWSSAGR